MSPTHDFNNIGDVLDFDIVKGTIVSVDGAADTCVVSVAGRNLDALLFYHCEPDSVLRDNGAIEGAAAGFGEDDEVIVLVKKDREVVKVIGHVGGPKPCGYSCNVILVPDMATGIYIPLSLKRNGYGLEDVHGLTPEKAAALKITRYQFEKDINGMLGQFPRHEYMPHVSRIYDISRVSVAPDGDMAFMNSYYDWHYKHYILDCTRNAGPDSILRPPLQFTVIGFGWDLHPPWYSMIGATARGFHYCFEAAIDQMKRIYQPLVIEVDLASDDISIPALTLLGRSGTRYIFQYPVIAGHFYGKNAIDFALVDDACVTDKFGGSIYASGSTSVSVPEGVDPVLYLWPWVPYIDEVRNFNILSYYINADVVAGTKWYVQPSLEGFREWSLRYYNNLGQQLMNALFTDSGSFSDWNYVMDGNTTNAPVACECGDCMTGIITTSNWQTVSRYSSNGIRYSPIGLIGCSMPIVMETTWAQEGEGPTWVDNSVQRVSGNWPYNTVSDPGGDVSIVDMAESCCVLNFASTGTASRTYGESASNSIDITQSLKIGDDVIFSGKSSMSYSYTHNLTENYTGHLTTNLLPMFECDGSISYTTTQMSINQQQTLSWVAAGSVPECLDNRVFRWAVAGGGSLSSTTEQTTIYTAPSSNPNCDLNPVISLICNDQVVDVLSIAINQSTSTADAYRVQLGWGWWYHPGGGYDCWGLETYWSPNNQNGACCVYYYTCNGAVTGRAQRICSCDGCDYQTALEFYQDCDHPLCTPGTVDLRTQQMKNQGCCPAALM